MDKKVEGNEGFPLELPRNGPAAGVGWRVCRCWEVETE